MQQLKQNGENNFVKSSFFELNKKCNNQDTAGLHSNSAKRCVFLVRFLNV